MTRETIDFGIDLGTTNSAIAVAKGADGVVIRNNLQREFTPSAVYVSKQGKVYVGDRARERVESDPANTSAEFKLQMGVRGEHKRFDAAGRSMTPEELSAEVLKSLRGDVQRSMGEEISSAVITVPAAFELDQCDATRRAAELAGLGFAPLLQEPTAAAWAYSAQNAPDRAFWLVYDFGGGTFDAAVIEVRDGDFTVVNHAGDNFLGGKLIDWGLLDGTLIPAVQREFGLADLRRDNPRWAGNIAKLKLAAENAKIQLSTTDAVDVDVVLDDGTGDMVDFTWELTRADLERVSRPLYERSIALCRRALSQKNLGPGDFEKVLLVGGTTLAPALREMLADPTEGLGIPIDHSLDPVTVIARGAAIFAGTQRRPQPQRVATESRFVLEFEHEPVGQDTEPLVGGRVRATGERDWSGFTIAFRNDAAQPAWHSGQVPLSAEGTFVTRLRAESNASNTYQVELRDQHGTLLETDPASIGYRHSIGPLGAAPVLSHSVGVGLTGNEVEWLLRKGTELPASKRVVLHTTVDVRRNSRTGLIRVPLLEGEWTRADRNTPIGRLDIHPHEVKRDVPAGSEIEVHIDIDRSFTPRAEAYVPLLDEEFEIEIELGRSAAVDGAALLTEVSELRSRYTELRSQARGTSAAQAETLLDEFDSSNRMDRIVSSAQRADVDREAAEECQSQLREAQSLLDEVEGALEMPALEGEARALLDSVSEMARDWGTSADQREVASCRSAIEQAISAGDRTVLRQQITVVRRIGVRILHETGRLDAVIFGQREQELSSSPDPAVQQALAEGRQALNTGDSGRLQAVNRKLDALMPSGGGEQMIDMTSTVRAGGHH
ncbi:Hsp70 family protein [Amycolatopsis suaedae]|uniref:Hsp70 family protein n=1 Tax=Amycolatopsis suaedae TaxID=2510978 RepID=A0A4Q7IZK3_9PSEU|nr:Hsp70 family protein [Amycolatopsis suaedae]RZQ60490.1 Hsp70 family protein [Amycolatopsis suaedae]